jgi:hypothetical protein
MKFMFRRPKTLESRDPLLLDAFLVFLALMGCGSSAHAASCCARSPAAPFLIVGDDKAQVNFGISSAHIVGDAAQDGSVAFNSGDISDSIWNYRFDGAVLLSDLFQVGLSVPMVTRSVAAPGVSETSTALGDVRMSLGYEFLPSWSYSAWKPQGFLFSVLSVPTGRSLYESSLPSLADVSGNGFYAVSVGALLIKRWATVDAFFLTEGHYSFNRAFSDAGTVYTVYPGFGASAGGGIGWSPGAGRLRVGVRIHPRLDQLESVVYPGTSNRALGYRWTTDMGLDAAFLLATTDTLMLSYTDQTLIGPSQSAPLNRSLVLSYQHRWER